MSEPLRPPLPPEGVALALSRFVAAMPNLPTVLGVPVIRHLPGRRIPPGAFVLAWGRKVSGLAAERFAARRGLPVLHVEDGFVRSVHPGRAHPPLSISLDDRGVYYDAHTPSRLEILAASPRTPDELARAARLAALWRDGRISKYNHAPEYRGELPGSFVLAVDQTFGDGSIRHGMAGPRSFTHMLEAALDEHPDKTVILKVHPEVVSGKKRGHFDMAAVSRLDRVRVFSGDVHPAGLLERAAAVYVVTSQMGFEGLLWGRPVSTFGMPFYAGWGLTADALPPPGRRAPISLERLTHAALVEYPRYVDPETGVSCEPERVMEWMALQRRCRERFPGAILARGFPPRRHAAVRRVFQAARVRFSGPEGRPRPGEAIAVPDGANTRGIAGTVFRLSSGLFPGAGLDAGYGEPLCALVDEPGQSLETFLATAVFPPDILERAARLRRTIVSRGLTLCPGGTGTFTRPEGSSRVVLAVGEGPDPDAEAGFLGRVRHREPDAYLVYKPALHILKTSRPRLYAVAGDSHFNVLMPSASMHLLLSQVDAVHVRISVAGLDALLLGKDVYCHARPFFAGWGLTRDAQNVHRRPRSLSLDELVAGSLLLYPAYVSGKTGYFCSPEHHLDELDMAEKGKSGILLKLARAIAMRLRAGLRTI